MELGPEGKALEQIKRKKYDEKYREKYREIYLIGIEFSAKENLSSSCIYACFMV